MKVLITGATGMVGEGVLHECLKDDRIRSIVLVTRKPTGQQHPKITEMIVKDFFDLSQVESSLTGLSACYFCLGVSSIGMKEPEYSHMTYDLTLHFARTLVKYNTDMVFCYISGSGTDSSEKGRIMWARVKGRTENDLLKLPFKAVYLFRPSYMHPTPGLKNTLRAYKYISWLYFVLKPFTSSLLKLEDIGRAMIRVTKYGYPKPVLEVSDIRRLSEMA